jgi:thiamine biosynthesis lipoprotein
MLSAFNFLLSYFMLQAMEIMGMPIRVEILAREADQKSFDKVFAYFTYVDEKFSTYKEFSEISKINRRELSLNEASREMQTVFRLSRETKQQTRGFFDILTPQGIYDPSGLVKGWAIYRAALLLKQEGIGDFFIEAGGDIQTFGHNHKRQNWSVGIKSPFDQSQIVKVIYLSGQGIATSGTYIRGQHIYNPHNPGSTISDIASLTVIGSNVYEADRFATAAFAMGRKGIEFIEGQKGLEGYMIDKDGIATMTSGFGKFV